MEWRRDYAINYGRRWSEKCEWDSAAARVIRFRPRSSKMAKAWEVNAKSDRPCRRRQREWYKKSRDLGYRIRLLLSGRECVCWSFWYPADGREQHRRWLIAIRALHIMASLRFLWDWTVTDALPSSLRRFYWRWMLRRYHNNVWIDRLNCLCWFKNRHMTKCWF